MVTWYEVLRITYACVSDCTLSGSGVGLSVCCMDVRRAVQQVSVSISLGTKGKNGLVWFQFSSSLLFGKTDLRFIVGPEERTSLKWSVSDVWSWGTVVLLGCRSWQCPVVPVSVYRQQAMNNVGCSDQIYQRDLCGLLGILHVQVKCPSLFVLFNVDEDPGHTAQ